MVKKKTILIIIVSLLLTLVTSSYFNSFFNSTVLKPSEYSRENDLTSYQERNAASYSPQNIEEGPFEFMIPENRKIDLPQMSLSSHVPSPITRKITGKITIAVLLVYFQGGSYSKSPAYYQNLLFNHSNPKSVASYYFENSYGELNITGEILGNKWFRSANTEQHWGTDTGTLFPYVDDNYDRIYNLAAEVVQVADPSVNFTRFDTDTDDIIDHLLIIHAGNAQESVSGISTDIWSHQWSIQSPCLVDDVIAKDYIMCAETSPLGTFIHELGHDLGNLPDLYDTDYSSDGIGTWGVMGAGAWNYNTTLGSGENPGDTPAHFCAWSKIKMGWVIPTIATENASSITLPAIETTSRNSVVKLFLSNSTKSVTLKEYFLVCYRQQTGFDSFIPGSGILIWHIDECSIENENSYEPRKMIDLEEADASLDGWEQLDYYQSTPPNATIPDDEGAATDVWASGSIFNRTSFPNSNSNDGVIIAVSIAVKNPNTIDYNVSFDPLPWDYTLRLMDQSTPSYIDDEPSLIEHSLCVSGYSSKFSVAFHSNRSGNLDIWGAQTTNAGRTWQTATPITSSLAKDFSPSLIIASPPYYWTGIYEKDSPVSDESIGRNSKPPPHYVVAFVSNRTGNHEIFVTLSPDFYTWSQPIQITNELTNDIDPCLFNSPSGIGLFWASNRDGDYDIYLLENIWNSSNIVQVTSNTHLDRDPSYFYTKNNTHLLSFEYNSGNPSTIQLLQSNNLLSWPSVSITCTDPSFVAAEPSLIERADKTLLLTFTLISPNNEQIHQVVSSDWIQWSDHLVMGFLKNASSPSTIEGKCGSLFMAYSSYNYSQLHHIYLIRTAPCFIPGRGIGFPYDTGGSFFEPQRVEIGSDWVFSGEMELNQSDFVAPANYISINVNDTKNTWFSEDDEPIIQDLQFDAGSPFVDIDPVIGTGSFNIPLDEFLILGVLPEATVLQLQVKWEYQRVDLSYTNVSNTLFIEILPPFDHIGFDGNIGLPTTFDTPLITQIPFIRGNVRYGVESLSISLYDTQNTPGTSDDTIYFKEILVFSEVVKVQGEWIAKIHNLKDNTITRIVATSNGIYPRKEYSLFLEKQPEDRNTPILQHLEPIELTTGNYTIVFSEYIADTQGTTNYGIKESSILFIYRIIYSQEDNNAWITENYDVTNSSWSKNGDIYSYQLTMTPTNGPIFIAYYWIVSDLAIPANTESDGDQEDPYLIGIIEDTIVTSTDTSTVTTMITTTVLTTVYSNASTPSSSMSTSSSSPPESQSTPVTTTFPLLVIIIGLIMFKRKRR
ncbi:MAG: M6 family metalloprotease domain-containing protein [Candidatus Hodarchaeales archaeon]|jgi:immune inhibitor A